MLQDFHGADEDLKQAREVAGRPFPELRRRLPTLPHVTLPAALGVTVARVIIFGGPGDRSPNKSVR